MCIMTTSLEYSSSHGVTLLNWMVELPDRKPYFLGRRFRTKFRQANRLSILAFKFLVVCVVTMLILVIPVQVALQYFIRGEKFYAPLRFELPFLPKDNWICYLINILQQSYIVLYLGFLVLVYQLFLMSILAHVLVYLDAIQLLIGNMKKGIEEGDFQIWLKTVAIEVRNVKV